MAHVLYRERHPNEPNPRLAISYNHSHREFKKARHVLSYCKMSKTMNFGEFHNVETVEYVNLNASTSYVVTMITCEYTYMDGEGNRK
jgi:hypothetical protein